VNSLCASAAYWIASQADEVVSTPGGLTGSIGVYTVHEDLSAASEAAGVKVTYISAGKYKTESQPFQPPRPCLCGADNPACSRRRHGDWRPFGHRG